jgi:hypothetical protein
MAVHGCAPMNEVLGLYQGAGVAIYIPPECLKAFSDGPDSFLNLL